MSDEPCTEALIEYRKTIRRDWNGAIDAEINRAFHHGYAAGQMDRVKPLDDRELKRVLQLVCEYREHGELLPEEVEEFRLLMNRHRRSSGESNNP